MYELWQSRIFYSYLRQEHKRRGEVWDLDEFLNCARKDLGEAITTLGEETKGMNYEETEVHIKAFVNQFLDLSEEDEVDSVDSKDLTDDEWAAKVLKDCEALRN